MKNNLRQIIKLNPNFLSPLWRIIMYFKEDSIHL